MKVFSAPIVKKIDVDDPNINVLKQLRDLGVFQRPKKKRRVKKEKSTDTFHVRPVDIFSDIVKNTSTGQIRKVHTRPKNFIPLVTHSLQLPDIAPIETIKGAFGDKFNNCMASVRHNLEEGTCKMFARDRVSFTQSLLMSTTENGIMKYLVRPKSSANAMMITRDGATVHSVPIKENVSPSWPLRMNYMNGGNFIDDQGNSNSFNAHFPFTMWPSIFVQRAQDITKKIPFFDNDVAYSDQGLCAFYELDYRNTISLVRERTMMEHAFICQDIMKEYYHANPDVDFTMWILICLPKPKMDSNLNRIILASGMHVVFPYITINAQQGRQLSASVSHRIKNKTGYINVVDTSIFKPNSDMVTLRPAYARKSDKCPRCLGRIEERIQPVCAICHNAKAIGCASVYVPKFLVNSSGSLLPIDKLVKENLTRVLVETSIIPPTDGGDYTSGYFIPNCATDPEANGEVPIKLTAKQKKAPGQTKHPTKPRKNPNLTTVTDPHVLEILTQAVRSFRTEHKYASIRTATFNASKYFVTLSSGGHRFCRIATPEGKTHNSNCIFFVISMKFRTIAQHCYDKDCKKILDGDFKTKNKLVVSRITSNAYEHHLCVLFPDRLPQHIQSLKMEESAIYN